ncbi:MAG TPA: hypothetical protein VG755_32950 [Nannocystaceae bacterium]|nr:hypothetical protein [Nannocystaceae bacterium]
MVRAHALLCSILFAACTAKEQAPPPRPIDETIEIAPRGTPDTKVLEPGAEPRRVLKLHPAVGTDETFEMRMGMRMGIRQGGGQLPSVAIPTTVTRMRSKVQEVEGSVFSVAQTVEGVELIPQADTPPQVTTQMRAAIDPLVHYRATVRMDERGAVLGGTVVVPGDLPAMVKPQMEQLAQNMGQIAVPLPPDAIGVGARWTATTDLDQSGMKLRQSGEYVLLALEGEHATIDATITQTLLEPEIQVPGMFGTTAKVGDFRSSGTSKLELDLDHLAPTNVAMQMDLHMAMDMTVLGQAQHTEMDLGLELQMKRN